MFFRKKYDKHDREFMSSLSEAVVTKNPKISRIIIYLFLISISWALFWAYNAEIDEITRGQGKVIPSGKNQIVQNLEGGIVETILVKEGDEVKAGQVIVRIENKAFSSNYGESQARLDDLNAKFLRLTAEANGKDFDISNIEKKTKNLTYELSVFNSNQAHLQEQSKILKEQLNQRKNELDELNKRIEQLQISYNLVVKEQSIMKPLISKGLVSEVEWLQLQKRVNDIKGELETSKITVNRINSAIKETANKETELLLSFQNKARRELAEVSAEIERLNEIQVNLSDRVSRTSVKSPVNGVISKLFINTISGVIKPGENIAEIVPLEDNLVAEVKIKPADVAFLREGMPTMVKFTAYDFSIYGGLKGKVTYISPDTQTNEKTGETFYLVGIQTDKNYLGHEDKQLKLKVGMIVNADIITGKKSILDYLLKPILKAKQNALTER